MSGGDFLKGIPSSKKKRRLLFLLASLLGIGLILAIFFFPSSPEKPQPVKMVQAPPPSEDRVLSGRIAKRDTLFSALCAQNIPADLAQNICSHLKPMVNLRKVKPGDSFEVRLTPEGKFREFTFQTSPIDIYHLAPTPDGKWVAAKKEVAVDKYWARVSGEITSSLFEAMDALGERDPLVFEFADIFSWEIDFNTEPQPGDRFQMVIEKYYMGNNFVKYGRILYAEYQSASRLMQGIYFQIPGRRGDYFTPQGHSLRKDLLRSPLKFTRVSSRYSKSRRHPILGIHRPHLGVDYAAPVGSPVWAVADGMITFCGENEGYGKQIIIKHAKGYNSMYGHLSQIAPGIKKGKAVRQKQIIGFVGSTGLSTGPHLDFRLLKNNVFRNPLREISPRAASLRPEQMDEFKEATDPVIRWVQDPANPKYRKVATLTSKDLENSKKLKER